MFRRFPYHFTQTGHGWIWASSYGAQSDLSTSVGHCRARTWAGLGFDTMTAADGPALIGDLFKEELTGHRLMGQLTEETNAYWRSFRTVVNRRWQDGTVALTGDSARTTHFPAGLGTTLARSLGRHASVQPLLPPSACYHLRQASRRVVPIVKAAIR